MPVSESTITDEYFDDFDVNCELFSLQNVKAITALVSEALRHSSQLEVILNKSKIFEKEEGLSKQKHLTKILITELLWGKKRLGGESKPVATVISYQEKFDKVLKMLEQQESLGEGKLTLLTRMGDSLVCRKLSVVEQSFSIW